MLNRKNQIIIRLNDKELEKLKNVTQKTGLTQTALFRMLLKGYSPKEKPDDRFYTVMRQIIGISNNLQQICRKANALDFIDAPALTETLRQHRQFEDDMRARYLNPDKLEITTITKGNEND